MNIEKMKKKSINPMMDFLSPKDYFDFLKYNIKKLRENQKILDVGGGRGKAFDVGSSQYYVLDLNDHSDKFFIKGDITSYDFDAGEKFDLILTKDTFEHILNPWDATRNILNALKEGGMFFCSVPFSWRFHPSPYDLYRYSHQGLKYLFERLGGLEEVDSGYIYYYNKVSGRWGNKLDFWPPKNIFNDNVGSYYIGRKNSNKEFDLSEIKGDFSLKHDHIKPTND